MLIDLHLHVQEYSADSHLPVRAAIARAKEMGLDALCITDHDTLGILETIDALREETGFPLFPGAEYLTLDGDFVVFGLTELPAPGLSAQALLDHVHAHGGAAICCHPFRTNNRGAGDKARQLTHLQGVECFNGSTSQPHNLLALRMADDLGLARIGASDAHRVDRVGRFATRFLCPIHSLQDLIHALHEGKTVPVMYQDNGFIDVLDSPYCRQAPEGDADL